MEKSTLLDVIRHAKPSVLIGVSGQAGAFTEGVVREMARNTVRPVIFPLSNPTARSEATPQDLVDWTEGRALIGTGSPFEPVSIWGKKVRIDQTNNSYIFPGLALGIIASRKPNASPIQMVMAAAKELARLVPTQKDKKASLLPSLSDSRQLSLSIAQAVGRQAIQDGQAQVAGEDSLNRELQANICAVADASFSFSPSLPPSSSAAGPRCRITWTCSGSGRSATGTCSGKPWACSGESSRLLQRPHFSFCTDRSWL
jgi:malate dehydrogenase (oxaloacetate-decarboxylating)